MILVVDDPVDGVNKGSFEGRTVGVRVGSPRIGIDNTEGSEHVVVLVDQIVAVEHVVPLMRSKAGNHKHAVTGTEPHHILGRVLFVGSDNIAFPPDDKEIH